MDLICSKESGGSPGWHQSCGKGEIEVQIGHFSWLWPGNHNHSSVLLLLSLRKLVDIQFLMSTKKLTRDKGRPYQGASLVCHSRWSVTLPFLRTNNQDCEAEAHACPEHDAFQPWKIHILLHTFDICVTCYWILLGPVATISCNLSLSVLGLIIENWPLPHFWWCVTFLWYYLFLNGGYIFLLGFTHQDILVIVIFFSQKTSVTPTLHTAWNQIIVCLIKY